MLKSGKNKKRIWKTFQNYRFSSKKYLGYMPKVLTYCVPIVIFFYITYKLILSTSLKILSKWSLGCSKLVEYMPSMCKALGSIFSVKSTFKIILQLNFQVLRIGLEKTDILLWLISSFIALYLGGRVCVSSLLGGPMFSVAGDLCL
jgi:hypothetical protein